MTNANVKPVKCRFSFGDPIVWEYAGLKGKKIIKRGYFVRIVDHRRSYPYKNVGVKSQKVVIKINGRKTECQVPLIAISYSWGPLMVIIGTTI